MDSPREKQMDAILKRAIFSELGIFGTLTLGEDTDAKIFRTLEHAYEISESIWMPKIPVGTYVCKRGMHQLEGMTAPFETFEILNVPGHTNILIHVGNYNKDSEGCVLIGLAAVLAGGNPMITQSREAFNEFMEMQIGVDEFTLAVV